MQETIRNIAIIAHVDHGKTTLVDAMLRHAGVFRSNEIIVERVMDSNDLEKERGITILAKNLSIRHKGVKINIVDTPGHADFGGEVERVLQAVDSVLLLVDAVDGPMPQTRFVLRKSMELGLRPVVVINKIDRPNADPARVRDQVFDLFCDLAVTEEQLEFPIIFTSARDGYAIAELDQDRADLEPLFTAIRESTRSPSGDGNAPFQMLITHIDYDDYIGRTATGKVCNGKTRTGEQVAIVKPGGTILKGKITRILDYNGLRQVEVEEASCGNIVTIAGLEKVAIGDTVTDPDHPEGLPYVAIEEPTIAMNFMVNTSPFAGREGALVTSRNIRERLHRELRTNLSLRVADTGSPDTFKVSGRGELHLAILIENMRREGYEMAVSRPEVIYREIDGSRHEPMEYLVIDVPSEHQGSVMSLLGPRKAQLVEVHTGSGTVRLEFSAPARGLIGLRGELLTETRGTAVMSHVFDGYQPYKGDISGRRTGALVSMMSGPVTAYAIESIQERGRLFIHPGTEVYAGMIVGENAKDTDIDVNPVREKKLTNMRSSTSEIDTRLHAPVIFSLEQAIEFIDDDELVEVTPRSIRLRKRVLDKTFRPRRLVATG
ncbi:MAG: translational GTPase TypA [bacterium]|nr:translational GTPase TypA [bacterium]